MTPVDEAARAEAEMRALEAAVAVAAAAAVVSVTGRVVGVLMDGFKAAVAAPARWLGVRRRAARSLRAVRPRVAVVVERMLPKAAQLGAKHAGGKLPAGHNPGDDPLIREVLDGLDDAVRERLVEAADVVVGRVDTSAQLDEAVRRVDAAESEVEAGVTGVVTRAAAGGAVAVAEEQGLDLVWRSERGACLTCTALSGAVAAPGGEFTPLLKVGAGKAVGLPPDPHPHCRCTVVPATEGLAEALAREAARSVARGESAHDSLRARLRAVDALLAGGGGAARLPKSVRERAARDRAKGQFSRRDQRRPA